MNEGLWIGLGFTVVAGLCAGNCMLPMKFARRWQWENLWLIFTVVSLILIPWALAITLVRDLGAVYAGVGLAGMVAPLLFGAGWGVAQVLFGLSVARLGLALGYAIIIGLGAMLGTLVPLFVQHREVIATPRGLLVLTGVAVMLAGIAVTSWAGRQREKAGGGGATGSTSYPVALALAILCGVLAPMLNYSFAFGQHIAAAAVELGTSPGNASYAVWPIGLAGGFVPNILYSIYLLNRNRTWGRFAEAPGEGSLAGVMGLLWVGSISLYGMGAVYLGELGTSAGWGLFQIFMILTANGSGMVTGEWKGTPRSYVRVFVAGLALLALATVIIAMGNR